MSDGMTFQRILSSGRTVTVTIDGDGFVRVEGATQVNVIYPFTFSNRGYDFKPTAGNENNYVAVHTMQDDCGILAEFSAVVKDETRWWSPSERPAIRLTPSGAIGDGANPARFSTQHRRGGAHQFLDVQTGLLILTEKAA